MQDHRKLRVWRQAHDLAITARQACRGFPRAGYASLKNQLIRAAESVALTLVEGCGATSPREFARFLDISIKSTMELEEQLKLAMDNSVLRAEVWNALCRETISVRRQLCALRARVLEGTGQPSFQRQ